MKYPEGEKSLTAGESYFWNVEGDYLVETDKSSNHKFTVLTPEKSMEVSERETIIRNTFIENPDCSSLHSVLGAYYIDIGLLQDAIEHFQAVAEINSDAPLPHEILGSLYSEIGEKDKAIEELQKALALTNNKEK
jgi:tetratricopeptide (TPR) repeat protein